MAVNNYRYGKRINICADPDCDYDNADSVPINQMHQISKKDRQHIAKYHIDR